LTDVVSWHGSAEFPHVSVNFKNIFEASLDDFPSPLCPTTWFEGIDKPYEGGILQGVQFCPFLAPGPSYGLKKIFRKINRLLSSSLMAL
jgi:hypothetical protein